MFNLKQNLLSFTGMYIIFMIGFLILIELLAEYFGFELSPSLSVIVLLATAGYVSQKACEQTGQTPDSRYSWTVSACMGVLGTLYGMLISVVYIVILVGTDNLGLVWAQMKQDTMEGMSPSGLVLVAVITLVVSVLIARLGWGLGLRNGLKRWEKDEIKRIR